MTNTTIPYTQHTWTGKQPFLKGSIDDWSYILAFDNEQCDKFEILDCHIFVTFLFRNFTEQYFSQPLLNVFKPKKGYLYS